MYMENRRKRKWKLIRLRLALAGILVLCAAVVAAVVLAVHYMPTGKLMSLYEYFDVAENDGVLVFVNGERLDTRGMLVGDEVYLPQSVVEGRINQRFYYDEETKGVLYADDTHVYTYMPDSRDYSDEEGNSGSKDSPLVVSGDGEPYLNLNQVADVTDMEYGYYSGPDRVVISLGNVTDNYVTVLKQTQVRYRGGVKSPVLEQLAKDDELVYRKNVGDWVEVQTASGVVGYVKSGLVSDITSKTRESSYQDDYQHLYLDGKVSLAWFQVEGTAGNQAFDSLIAQTQGINVVSPTWYAISGNDGSMNCYAAKDIVDRIHGLGMQVWPLVNDFSKELDTVQLFGGKSNRSRLIGTLMSDAAYYGYDGINLDFENVSKDGAADFLQFVRELSVECQKKGIILSMDNYKAESYNAHYDLAEQAAYADYVVLMGYDEHYAGSSSGSVASIGFVEDGIQKALNYVPKQQLINAMPFYTRIWTESDGKTTSTAVGMQSAINNLSSNGAVAVWDETLGQYFGSYEKDGAVVKVWVEEDRSIEEKLKLYQKYDLAGVAAWKLGLERSSVWSVIAQYVK
jgi:spore germination protein YaaH